MTRDYAAAETARRYNKNSTQRKSVNAGANNARIPQSSERLRGSAGRGSRGIAESAALRIRPTRRTQNCKNCQEYKS